MLVDTYRNEINKPKRRRFWVHVLFVNRSEASFFNELYNRIKSIESSALTKTKAVSFFTNYVRISLADFDHLLNLVAPLIVKQDTNKFRLAVPPRERLAVTFRYLATGENFTSLRYVCKIADCTVSCIVYETCIAIYNALKDEYLKVGEKMCLLQMFNIGFIICVLCVNMCLFQMYFSVVSELCRHWALALV